MLTSETEQEQRRLDMISEWLSETTEELWDWQWDGEELVVFPHKNVNKYPPERYTFEDLRECIEDFE
jgi:hypothetical protein